MNKELLILILQIAMIVPLLGLPMWAVYKLNKNISKL